MKRRDLLKAVGSIVTALGISEFDLLRLGDRYSTALAQAAPRKLALLVGINEYKNLTPLNGCLTDVELQRELLIHRFGFKAQDVVSLSNQQATRQHIEAAFREHLAPAQPGDAVVFHFSGYGRRIRLSADESQTINALVAVDGVTSPVDTIDDLLEAHLWELLRSLQTNNVTTILDTSFANLATPAGKLKVRSCPPVQFVQGLELEAPQLNLTADTQLQLPGLMIAAAKIDQPAIEAQWGGFSAGLLTYALTQSLWEAKSASTIQISLSKASGVVEQVVGKEQQPQLSGQNHAHAELSAHFMPATSMSADGAIIAVEDGTAQLWLAGLEPTVLQYYGVHSRLNVIVQPRLDDLANSTLEKATATQLQVRSRSGLTAKAQLSDRSTGSLQVGQLLQEAVRVLPRNVHLNIALDPRLERIERVDATSAFATISYVSLITADEPADYIFGRVRDSASASRYGLFTLGQELVANSAGEAGEAIKVAVQRLALKLRTLLAGKLWRLTSNASSSRLAVKVSLEVLNANNQLVIEYATSSTQSDQSDTERVLAASSPTLPIGSRIQYRIDNNSDRPIYLLLLGLDSNKNAIALYPGIDESSSTLPLQSLSVAPGETLIPQNVMNSEWVLHGPPALWEMQLIFSRQPFTQAVAALSTTRDQRQEGYMGGLPNPLEVAQAAIQDLHNASAIAPETIGAAPDMYTLDVNAWASFNFLYQVV